VVVAPDYTKSVQAPYPTAINDCEDTLDWLLEQAVLLNIETNKLIIVAGPHPLKITKCQSGILNLIDLDGS